MRRICEGCCVGLALMGCGAHGAEAARVSEVQAVREPVVAARAVPEPVVAVEPVRRSCKASAPAREVALQLGDHRVEVDGRSFVHAWRRDGVTTDTVVLGVDARGEPLMVAVPVPPGDPLAMGADARGIVIVSVPRQGTGVLVRVELQGDGSLRAGKAIALPEIGWGWPGSIASDGTRALVQHTLATAQQSMGEEVLVTVDLAAGRVLAAVKTGASTRCAAGACTTLSTREGTRLWWRTPAGEEASGTVALTSGCPAVYSVGEDLLVLPGAPWRALVVAGKEMRAVAVADTLVPIAGCGAVWTEFPSRRWPGLASARSVLRWDAATQIFGAAEGLPGSTYARTEWFEHADGVIEIGWRGGSGMMHTPTDSQGRRRYFKDWYFEGGEVRLLRREGGAFVASDAAPLVLSGADGKMHEGYVPTLLRNGPHAVVLIASQGGDDMSWWQPYLAPCEAG